MKKLNLGKDVLRSFPLREVGGPNGPRTRVFGVRGRCPRPLDDGTVKYVA